MTDNNETLALNADAVDPATVVSTTTYANTLEAVNRIRTSYGHEPLTRLPAGFRCSANCCALANAFHDVAVTVAGARTGLYAPPTRSTAGRWIASVRPDGTVAFVAGEEVFGWMTSVFSVIDGTAVRVEFVQEAVFQQFTIEFDGK